MSKHQNTEDKKHWLHCHYYYSGISVPLISAFTPKPTEMTEIAKGNQNYLENSQEQGRKQNNNRGFWFKMTTQENPDLTSSHTLSLQLPTEQFSLKKT